MTNEIIVPAELDGARADKAVAALAGVSRSTAKEWCATGAVLFDGEEADAAESIRAGQCLSHPDPPPQTTLQPDSSVAFSVLYEDDDVAVVDKPAGLVVHPGAGRRDGTLASGVLARWPRVAGVGEAGRWGIVHRLDRETSGVLIVALTQRAHGGLTAALAARAVERTYWAGVQGRVASETGTIDAPIGRDPQHPTRMAVHRNGRPARTHYRRIGLLGDDQLLEVRLDTGRTHQIRVHLSSIHHPVIGDRLYGWRGAGWKDRIWLHARRIGFEHPVTGARVEVEAALPPDLHATTLGHQY